MKYNEIPRTASHRLEEAEDIGRQMQLLRKAVGMTQAEAAQRAGISRSTAVLIESGDGSRTMAQLLRYLQAISPNTTLLNLLQKDSGAVKNMFAKSVPQRVRRSSGLPKKGEATETPVTDKYDF